MIIFINRDNREEHRELVNEMFRLRKSVFIDALGWDLKVVNGDMEIDEFDTEDASYLICTEDKKRCLGSMRLIPTMRPHLMSEVLPYMCRGDILRGEKIWESTRSSCVTAGLGAGGVNRIMSELYYGVIEASLVYGYDQITFVANMKIVAGLAQLGWDMIPLGIPQYVDNEINIAMAINVTPGSMEIVRKDRGLDQINSIYPERAAA